MSWIITTVLSWLTKKTGRKSLAYLLLAAIAAAIVVMLCGTSYWRGYRSADRKAELKALQKDNQTLAAQVKQQASQLDTTVTTANERLTQLETLQHENATLTLTLSKTQGELRIVYRKLRQQAAQLAATGDANPDASGSDDLVCTVSGQYVGLWNAALAPAERSASIDGNELPEASGDLSDALAIADLADTRISISDLLSNHIDNAELNTEIRRQCTALIEWHEQHDK